MMKTIIVDDFYDDVDEVRRRGLRVRLVPRDAYVGKTSRPGRARWMLAAAARFQRLIGEPVRWSWNHGAGTFATMEYREVRRAGFTVVHHDPLRWVCMVYLNRQADCHGGTAFYRHKRTGLLGVHDVAATRRLANDQGRSLRRFLYEIGADARKPECWELVDRVAMRENRAIVYDGRRFHSHWLELDKMKKVRDPRLTQTFFTVPDPRLRV